VACLRRHTAPAGRASSGDYSIAGGQGTAFSPGARRGLARTMREPVEVPVLGAPFGCLSPLIEI
jgi:hypothetical protein